MLTRTVTPIAMNTQALTAFFTALQEYPDFTSGLEAGKTVFWECFGKGPLTSQEILGDIEEVFSKRNLDNFLLDLKAFDEHLDHPHMFLLGMVVGEISESYTA
jgi:hypothetical protein